MCFGCFTVESRLAGLKLVLNAIRRVSEGCLREQGTTKHAKHTKKGRDRSILSKFLSVASFSVRAWGSVSQIVICLAGARQYVGPTPG